MKYLQSKNQNYFPGNYAWKIALSQKIEQNPSKLAIIDCSVFVMLTSLLFNVNCYSALVPLAGTNTGAQMYGRSYSMFDIAKR